MEQNMQNLCFGGVLGFLQGEHQFTEALDSRLNLRLNSLISEAYCDANERDVLSPPLEITLVL